MPEKIFTKSGGVFVGGEGSWWLAESFSAEGYVTFTILASFGSRGRRGHMLSYSLPNQVGGVLCRWWCTLLVEVAEAKR